MLGRWEPTRATRHYCVDSHKLHVRSGRAQPCVTGVRTVDGTRRPRCKDDISHLSEEVTSFKTRPLTSDQHPSTYRRGEPNEETRCVGRHRYVHNGGDERHFLQLSTDPPCLTRTRQLPLPAGLELNRREPSLGATHGGAVIGRCVRAATGGEEARSASTSAAIRASKLASLRPPLVGPTSAPARARLSATSRWPERHA